jgi:hypothetical protein
MLKAAHAAMTSSTPMGIMRSGISTRIPHRRRTATERKRNQDWRWTPRKRWIPPPELGTGQTRVNDHHHPDDEHDGE